MAGEVYSGVKFKPVFVLKHLPHHPLLEDLKKWCAVFHERGLTPPYPGGSYGNLSFRTQNNSFIITGTSIALQDAHKNASFVEVTYCNMPGKNVYIKGVREPSSESFMHHLIYKNRPDVYAVFHGHNALLTQNATRLGIPETRYKTDYGSVALADSVLEILSGNNFIVIKDHGFVSMAENMQAAGNLALQWLEKAEKIIQNNF